MSFKPLLQCDDLDTRREVFYLLQKLPTARRLDWLHWCCSQCVFPNSAEHPGISPDHDGNAMKCYFDHWILVSQYRLDPAKSLAALERLAKRR